MRMPANVAWRRKAAVTAQVATLVACAVMIALMQASSVGADDPEGVLCVMAACPLTESSGSCSPAASAEVAIRHINARFGGVVGDDVVSQLPAGFTLQLAYSASGNAPSEGVEAFVSGLRAEPCGVVVGAQRSDVTGPLAVLATAENKAVVTFASTAEPLSRVEVYGLFARTIPSDARNVDSFIDLMLAMGWRSFAVLNRDNAWGVGIKNVAFDRATLHGLNVVATAGFPASTVDEDAITEAATQISHSGARIVLLVCGSAQAEAIFLAAEATGLARPGTVFISIETTATAMLSRAHDPEHLARLLHGMIVINPAVDRNSAAFLTYVEEWGKQDANTFDAGMGTLDPELFQSPPDFFGPFAYDAVWLAALSYAAAFNASGSDASAFSDGAAIHDAMLKVSFSGATGEVSVDSNGNRKTALVHVYENVVDDAGTTVVAATRAAELGVDILTPFIWSDGTDVIPSDGVSCPDRLQYDEDIGRCAVRIGVLFRAHSGDGTTLAPWRRQASLMGALAAKHFNARDSTAVPLLADPEVVGERSYVSPVFGDTFSNSASTVSELLRMYFDGPLAAVAGYSKSSSSRSAAEVATSFAFPYFSASATSSSLSNAGTFPFFGRVVPPDSTTATGVAHLCASMGFTRVAVVAEGDSFGSGFAADFGSAAHRLGISVATVALFGVTRTVEESVEAAVRSHSRIFLLIAQDTEVVRAMVEFERLGAVGEGYAWLVSDATSPQVAAAPGAPPNINELCAGFVRMQATVQMNPRFDALQQIWAGMKDDIDQWRQEFPELEITDDFFDTPFPSAGAFVYDCVMALSLASSAFSMRDDGTLKAGSDIMDAVRSLSFLGASGLVEFDDVSDRALSTVTIGIQNFVPTEDGQLMDETVGFWTLDGGVQLDSELLWPGSTSVVPSDGAQCDPGSYFDDDQLDCVLCEPGTSFDADAFACVRCAPGTHAPEAGMSDCISCDNVGGFSNANGSSACDLCPANTARFIGSPGVSRTECVCKEGFYAPEGVPGVPCQACPAGSVCEGGTMPPYPKPGWWSSPQHPSLTFFCGSETICAGGPQHNCSKSRRNAMCSDCAVGYFRLGKGCIQCFEPHEFAVAATFLGIIAVVVTWALLNSVAMQEDNLDLGLLFAQIISHIQELSLAWPSSLQLITTVFTLLNFDVSFLSPACITPDWDNFSTYLLQLLLPLLWGGMVSLMALFSYLHLRLYRSGRRTAAKILQRVTITHHLPSTRAGFRSFVDKTITRFIMLNVIIYNGLCKTSFDAFVCTEMPDGTGFVSAIPSVACNSAEHSAMKVIGVLGIILYVVGTPAFIFLVVYSGSKHDMLRDPRFLARYGFLYTRYTSKTYYWECVLIARRVAICLVLVFLQSRPFAQALAGLLVLMACGVAHFYVEPYAKSSTNVVDSIGLSACLFYITCGINFQAGVSFTKELGLILEAVTWGTLALCIILTLRSELTRYKGRTAARLLDKKIRAHDPTLHTLHARLRSQSRNSQPVLTSPSSRKASLISVLHGQSSPRPSKPGSPFDADFATGMPEVVEAQDDASASDDEHALDNAELINTFYGEALLAWVQREGDAEKLNWWTQADAWLEPFVCDESAVSCYSRSTSARLWRHLLESFPWLVDFLLRSTAEEANTIKKTMAFLVPAFERYGSAKPEQLLWRHVVPEDRGPLCLWYTMNASAVQRRILTSMMVSMNCAVRGIPVPTFAATSTKTKLRAAMTSVRRSANEATRRRYSPTRALELEIPDINGDSDAPRAVDGEAPDEQRASADVKSAIEVELAVEDDV